LAVSSQHSALSSQLTLLLFALLTLFLLYLPVRVLGFSRSSTEGISTALGFAFAALNMTIVWWRVAPLCGVCKAVTEAR
jgi:hypothetical protein